MPKAGKAAIETVPGRIRVLLIEDSSSDAELMIREFTRAGLAVEHRIAERSEAFLRELAAFRPDIILSDFSLPDFDGTHALAIARQRAPHIPFIFVSGTMGEEHAIRALKEGATDYVLKTNLIRLPSAVERALRQAREAVAKREIERVLREKEAGLRRAQLMAHLAHVITGHDGSFESWSDSLPELLGVPGAQMPGNTRAWLDLVHPDDRARFRDWAIEGGRTGKRVELEYQLKRADGSWAHIKQVSEPMSAATDAAGRLRWFNTLQDVSDQKLAAQSLRDSEARFRSLTQLSADWYWEQDEEYRFVDFSGGDINWGPDQSSALGLRRWDLPGASPAIGAWEEHKVLLAARLPFRNFEYGHTRVDGTRQYLSASGEPVFDAGGRFTGYRGVASSIADRKRAESVLSLEHGVARQLADANTANGGLQAAMQLVCESEGWDFGRYWRVDQAAGLLRFADAWSLPGADSGGVTEGSRAVVFAPGVGLAGKVWQSGQPLWVANIGEDARVEHKDLVRAAGMRGAFVFPLAAEGEIIGVLAFSSREIRQPDERLLAAVRVIGGQIGQFLRRKEADDKIRRLSRVHAVLSGINALIVRVRDRDELFREACRIAVEAGNFSAAWMGVLDRAAMAMLPAASHGMPDNYIEAIRDSLRNARAGGGGIAGQAIREKRAVISNDVANDPRVGIAKKTLALGTQSLAVLPFLSGDELVGVLSLHARETGFFDAEEMKLLHELAGDIAFALEHIEKKERLDFLAYYDQLTGLANRTLFHERLSQHLSAARAAGGKLAVVVADIERFRMINDSLGRQAGDALLKQVAERFAREVERTDIARIGSDQFAIVLPEMKGRSEIGRMVEELWRSCLDEPFKLGDTEIRIAMKGGIALFPSDGTDADALFRTAEAAWKKAKQTGERYLFHAPEMTARIAEKLTLENKLRQALEKEEFVLHYQPKVDLDARSIVGVEALIRWNSPERGLVPPGLFIPLLEETGLILQVGEWALKRATLDHGRWLREGVAAPRIAVNVSAIQLRQRDFVEVVKRAIAGGADPTAIDVEITESLLMEDVAGNIEKLKALRELGMKISIDDFGTGYSSLGYLAKLPVHILKIDRSFIITMLNDPDTMTLVSTIISLAHSLRLTVVAEGVEQEDQAKMLRLLRCDQMQGYLYSKPLPFEQLTPLLRGKS